MKTNNVWFGILLKPSLEGLREYYEMSESRLTLSKNTDLSRIEDENKKTAQRLKLNDEQQYAEWDIAMQEHEATYDMLQANFLRYSFIVLAQLVLTDHLDRFCQALQEFKHHPASPPVPTGEVIKQYKLYIQNVGFISEPQLWEPIFNLNTIRNCIVHSSGDLSRSRYAPKIRELAKKGIGIHISSISDRSDLTPLYLSDNRLMVDPTFCHKTVDDISNLFVSLCKAADIPTKLNFKDGHFIFET